MSKLRRIPQTYYYILLPTSASTTPLCAITATPELWYDKYVCIHMYCAIVMTNDLTWSFALWEVDDGTNLCRSSFTIDIVNQWLLNSIPYTQLPPMSMIQMGGDFKYHAR